jgi:hypothetical protein
MTNSANEPAKDGMEGYNGIYVKLMDIMKRVFSPKEFEVKSLYVKKS